jgi:serine/threonine-protein kinase
MLASSAKGIVAHTRIDRYEIKDILGQGGMGVVYRAYDPNRKGFVALKTMRDAADPGALELFNQEWRTLANLSHPNIVTVLNSGAFEDEGQQKPFFVMPLLPGKTLDKLIKDSGHLLTVERVVEILVQTCRGLQAAHASGLVHRDLKPSNLFVLSDDSVMIIDFGMVHLNDAAKSVTGIKGTLHYMAPEQLEMKEVTAATDVFALGVVGYEALTGRKPFERPNDRAIVEAIRHEFAPPASELNPAVDKTMAQVIAKAMAKNPWNRFGSAREFSDYLQRALKGEPIEGFDTARLQPRLERARKALLDADFDYAHEILNELQLEGHVDSEIRTLLDQVREGARAKVLRQLLDSARARLQEEEFPLAWQKIQEALQRDPGNPEALSLQAEIDTRRSDQQVEKWRKLVHQHLHNNSFTQARHAIEEIRRIRDDEPSIRELLQTADRRQQEYQKACEEKEQHFQSAMRAYGSGEISAALSKLEKILAIDSRTPGFSLPGREEVYRETYEKVRSEWESVQHARAEVERAVAGGDLARAADIANEQGAKYPNDLDLQGLKLKVDDLRRQQKSAYIAETARQVESEPDLNRRVQYLEEALARYPNESHFEELATSLRKKRDLVDSIVAKARQCEEQGMLNEALGQWTTLRNIYPQFPGLDFELQRVVGACDLQRRQEAKIELVSKIDTCLQSGEYDRAYQLAVDALESSAADQELQTLKRLAQEARDRSSEAIALTDQAQTLITERKYPEAIEALRRAASLDPHSGTISSRLTDTLAAQAQVVLASDWRASESLVQEALQVAPEHVLAKSLRPAILMAKRADFIDRCASEARARQASGDLAAALDKIQQGLIAYPNDGRLTQLQKTLREQLRLRRDRDCEELKQAARGVEQRRDKTSLTALLERSLLVSKLYPDDREISEVVSEIKQKAESEALDQTKIFVTNSGAEAVPAKEPVPTEQATSPQSKDGPKGQLQRRGIAQVEGWLAPAKLFLGRLSLLQRSVLVAVTVLVFVAILVIATGKRVNRTPPPPPPVAAKPAVKGRIVANVEGAIITVDGKPWSGPSGQLEQGPHQIVATKLGYKSIDKPLSVTAGGFDENLALAAEPTELRIAADTPAARVLLDDNEIGVLDNGIFGNAVPGEGTHTVKLLDVKKEILAVQFDVKPGEPPRVVTAPSGRNVPVAVVSRLGSKAALYASSLDAKLTVQGHQPEAIPAGGRNISVSASDTEEISLQIGTQSVTVSVEGGNAPVLAIWSGGTTRGMLVVEANIAEADVYVDGRKSTRRLQHGQWLGQYEAGAHQVTVMEDGYDRVAPLDVTVKAGQRVPARFQLTRSITTAFLRIEGATPDADVMVDDKPAGKIGPDGGFGPVPLQPDVAHSIHLEKENFEPGPVVQRRPSVKDTVVLTGPDLRLTPFGLLQINGPLALDAKLVVQREGGTPKSMSGLNLHLPQGNYVLTATAADERYDRFVHPFRIKPGETYSLDVKFSLRNESTASLPVQRQDLAELFTTKNWQNEAGFWHHDGPAQLTQRYFQHEFEFLRIKKPLGRQEKIAWRTNINANDYIEFEVDGTNYTRRFVVAGRSGPQLTQPHGAGKPDYYRIAINVQADRISITIGGKQVDSIDQKVEGPTSLRGKFALRLIR